MKKTIGYIIIILGIALGIYIGGYLMLYGGIIDIINNAEPLHLKGVAIGILKVVFCEVGVFPIYLGAILGSSIIINN